MAKIEIKGKVVALLEKQTFTDSVKQTVVIHEVETTKDGGMFESDVAVDFWGDKIQKIENLKAGDMVEVAASVRSNEWKEKYFTNVYGFFCKTVSKSTEAQNDGVNEGVNEGVDEGVNDDLPF